VVSAKNICDVFLYVLVCKISSGYCSSAIIYIFMVTISLFPNMKKFYGFSLLIASVLASGVAAHAQYISTFAGTGVAGYSGDGGPAAAAAFNGCSAMAVDGVGNIFIADQGNNVVRKISVSGVISTFAGTGEAGYGGNGGAATAAKLNNPMGLAADADGNIYIADNGNNVVRVVNTAGIIKNFAGTGASGYSGDGDTAHYGTLRLPQALAISATGDLFIAEGGNHIIRKVAAGTRIMSTVAGTGAAGNMGDGGSALAARLNTPSGVAVSASGDIYIADVLNNKVRKVDGSTGVITTFAGTGMSGNSGDNGPAASATFSFPSSVSLDMSGNVYITDRGNHNLRMVEPSGIVRHIAGQSVNGYSGDGDLAANARLSSPRSVYVDGWNRVYIMDYNNNVVRRLQATASVSQFHSGAVAGIYPSFTSGYVSLDLSQLSGSVAIRIVDVAGKVAYTGAGKGGSIMPLELGHLADGTYFVTLVSAAGVMHTGKVVVAH